MQQRFIVSGLTPFLAVDLRTRQASLEGWILRDQSQVLRTVPPPRCRWSLAMEDADRSHLSGGSRGPQLTRCTCPVEMPFARQSNRSYGRTYISCENINNEDIIKALLKLQLLHWTTKLSARPCSEGFKRSVNNTKSRIWSTGNHHCLTCNCLVLGNQVRQLNCMSRTLTCP